MKTQNTGKMGYITSQKKKKEEITYSNFANVVSPNLYPLNHITEHLLYRTNIPSH